MLDSSGENGPHRSRTTSELLYRNFEFCCIEPFTDLSRDQLEVRKMPILIEGVNIFVILKVKNAGCLFVPLNSCVFGIYMKIGYILIPFYNLTAVQLNFYANTYDKMIPHFQYVQLRNFCSKNMCIFPALSLLHTVLTI
jgi:hypothetical protein